MTAVEWLKEQIEKRYGLTPTSILLFRDAKEMEKQQIIEALENSPEPNEKLKKAFKDFHKQETLEEIAEQFEFTNGVYGFKQGAKWQQERMYSEEEVLQLLLRLQQTEFYDNLYDWFEKYKKK